MSAWQITRCKFLPAPRDTREGGEDSGVIDWRQRNAGPVIKTVGDPLLMWSCDHHGHLSVSPATVSQDQNNITPEMVTPSPAGNGDGEGR